MRIWEVEAAAANRTNRTNRKNTRNAGTDFERNVRKLKSKRRSVDAEKPLKPVKPS